MTGVSNLGSFLSGLRFEEAEINKLGEQITRKVALDVLSNVVLATPVDTGRARGNWQADINSTPVGELDTADKGGGETVSKGAGAIGRATLGDAINIVNNLPYVGRLNDGSSAQAPAGFVENAIDAATRFTR